MAGCNSQQFPGTAQTCAGAVRWRGSSACWPRCRARSLIADYAMPMIFDRLEGTLFQRLSQWRKRARDDEMLHAIHKRKKYPETLKLFIQRIKIARDIADAFS